MKFSQGYWLWFFMIDLVAILDSLEKLTFLHPHCIAKFVASSMASISIIREESLSLHLETWAKILPSILKAMQFTLNLWLLDLQLHRKICECLHLYRASSVTDTFYVYVMFMYPFDISKLNFLYDFLPIGNNIVEDFFSSCLPYMQ